jgi:hypothetical protein
MVLPKQMKIIEQLIKKFPFALASESSSPSLKSPPSERILSQLNPVPLLYTVTLPELNRLYSGEWEDK